MTPYAVVLPDAPLEQGDVLDDCPIYSLAPPDNDPDGGIAERRTDLRVIALTQTCDLAQQKSRRVVVAPVFTAELVVASGLMKASQIRDQVRLGRVFGWYYLPAAPTPIPLAESVVDVRQLYTLPRSTLDALVAAGKRVCRLATPYREHLAQHFAVTYMRIALPDPYETSP